MEKSNVTLMIKLKNGIEIELLPDEAKDLYEKLNVFFGGEKRVESYPVPYPVPYTPTPYPAPYTPTPYPTYPAITWVSTAVGSSSSDDKCVWTDDCKLGKVKLKLPCFGKYKGIDHVD